MGSRSILADLGVRIKAKRSETGEGLRSAAEHAGVSASTLSRLERGAATSLPDADTLAKLAKWLDTSIDALFGTNQQDDRSPQKTVPEIVEVHLRADKDLEPEVARHLASMFKLMYEQLKSSKVGK